MNNVKTSIQVQCKLISAFGKVNGNGESEHSEIRAACILSDMTLHYIKLKNKRRI